MTTGQKQAKDETRPDGSDAQRVGWRGRPGRMEETPSAGAGEEAGLEVLRRYWGYDSFRGIQQQVIESVLAGRDTLGLMPTGGGKSVCFQVPALMREGLCIVVTPLISLMNDQVRQLKQRGVRAEAVCSGMSHDDIVRVLDNSVLGAYKLLYVSPERLGSELFQAKLMRMRQVSMLVVDEAHCISQWGYDFRPAYLQIAQVRQLLPPGTPVLALTATATPRVVDDIQEQLRFREKNAFSMSFERKNLIYVVRETEDRAGQILHILHRVPQGAAIVYARTRQQTFDVARYLTENGVEALNYHAGMTSAERNVRQTAWLNGQVRVMVATNAFGMGIDKPDVRLVIHYNMPDSIEAYFQEAGRAGRDGKTSYAVLLHNRQDIKNLSRRVAENYPDIDYVRKTYENVSCFLQVGVGEARGKTFFFNMNTFCRNFRQFPVQTASALSLLSAAGYVEWCEEREYKSAVHFILRRDALYRLRENDTDTDTLIQAILRSYSGVFANFVYIEETHLAHVTGLSAGHIYEILKDLHRRRIIDYIPRRRTPTVGYPIARVETEAVSLPAAVYADRMEDFKTRIGRMSEYATSTDKCRSRMLLEYFGDLSAGDCGMCDVCVARRGRDTDEVEAACQAVRTLLADGKAHSLDELKSLALSTSALDDAVRQLSDEEEIVVEGFEVRKK